MIQAPYNTQSLNRYSYVWNNPLNATDPSGYFVFTLAALIYTAAVEGIKWYVAAAIFAAAGFADALLQGASFKDALKSGLIAGVSAAAFVGIGNYLNTGFPGDFAAGLDAAGFTLKVGLHGAVGGITSVLQGGDFGHGFAAAGFTALAASFNNSKFIGGKGFSSTRVLIGAVIGGTASKLSGGKFSNGAITGAFSQALNNERTEQAKVGPPERYVITVAETSSDGSNFTRAAETLATDLEAAGYHVDIIHVNSIEEFSAAISDGGQIAGMTMLGHGFGLGGGITFDMTASGSSSNLTPDNIGDLSFENFSTNAVIDVRHCNSCMQPVWTDKNFAELLHDSSGLKTIGYTKGLSFTGADKVFRGGAGAVPPSKGPIYLMPNPNSQEVRYGF